MDAILYIIGLPVLTGILLFAIPDRLRLLKGLISLGVTIVALFLAVSIYFSGSQVFRLTNHVWFIPDNTLFADAAHYVSFQSDTLCKLITLFIGISGVLIHLYSLVYMVRNQKIKNYYEYFLITLGASFGAVMTDNLLLFIFFWGILGITLYRLIRGNSEESSATAEKTLIMIGASDAVMILGIAIIWLLSGKLNMSEIRLETNNTLSVIAFFALLIGSFTKAGAFPFHTWIPDYTKYAPAPSSAYLPASLDKLLGIYFLARITTNLFVLNDWLTLILLTIGVITIITAAMMALHQNNFMRLLGYSTVSQFGYMILGFGLGSLIGVAAGLFHMINNVFYKSGLFLSAGSVEYKTGRENIDNLGGLSKVMPITFVTSLIFALSISGIPPLNGFASKWMIYQAIVDFGSGSGIANKLWILWLSLAVFGSALTLAYFIKFIGGIFLSRRKEEFSHVKEVPLLMWLPPAILAILCIGFGVFATNWVVPKLFMPVTGTFEFSGIWNSALVSLLILVSIVLGVLIYLAGNIKNFRTEDSFIGGEKIQDKAGYATPEFYKTLGEFKFFSWMYKKAEEKLFDLFDLVKKSVLWFSGIFSRAHTGLLHDYVIWVFAGLIIMLIILI